MAPWNVIEAWAAEHAPESDFKFRPPASPAAIQAAEKTLGRQLPAELRASLAVHDGQDDEPDMQWLPAVDRLASLESFVACFVRDRDDAEEDWLEGFDDFDDSGRVRQCYWHQDRIPIAGSTYWDYDRLLLDYCPGPNGTDAQVVVRWSGEHVFLCGSFGELMERTAAGMTSGHIVIVDGRVQWLSPRARKPIHYTKFYAS